MAATNTRIHITDAELVIIKDVLRKALSGQAVFVFGSRARGDHRKTSDIDLAILGAEPISMLTRSELEFGFSESDLPFRVDIVDLQTADDKFRDLIQAESIPLEY